MGSVVAIKGTQAAEQEAGTASPSRVNIAVRDGTCAVEWSEDVEGSCVRLVDGVGNAIVEYRPGEGTCRIVAGRVELRAQGDLELAAERRVRIRGERGVEIASGQSRVALEPEQLELRSERIAAKASRLEWSAALVRVVGEHVETEAKRLAQRVGELDTTARKIVERARDTFREAEGLAQTRAGRMRLVAEGTLWALAHRAMWKAEENVTVRGKRIYLE